MANAKPSGPNAGPRVAKTGQGMARNPSRLDPTRKPAEGTKYEELKGDLSEIIIPRPLKHDERLVKIANPRDHEEAKALFIEGKTMNGGVSRIRVDAKYQRSDIETY